MKKQIVTTSRSLTEETIHEEELSKDSLHSPGDASFNSERNLLGRIDEMAAAVS